MGYSLADELASRGAEVILISGPTHLNIEHPNIKLIRVKSADEMYNAGIENFSVADVAILSAAVADYKPAKMASRKIKKSNELPEIKLIQTPDLLAELGKRKTKSQLLVGFALETDNELGNAVKKLKNKNLDFIVLNSLKDEGAGFGYSTNKVTIIDKHQKIDNFDLKSKREVALDIINKVVSLIASEHK